MTASRALRERQSGRPSRAAGSAHVWPIVALTVLLLCLRPPAALAQFTRFESFSEPQGLTNQAVTALVQDASGYMLMGTEGGLYRYDGQSIARYGLAQGLPGGRWVKSLQRDRQGRIWIVLSDGIYVREQGRFHQVDLGGTPLRANGPNLLALLDDAVVADARGLLLRAPLHDGRIGRFVPMLGARQFGPHGLKAHFVAADGDKVVFGCGTALCLAGADGVPTVLGPASGLPEDDWQVAFRATDGTLWTRSVTRLAWRRPGDTGFSSVAIPGSHQSYLAEHPILFMLGEDGRGGIFTQGDDGMLRWDGAGSGGGGGWKAYVHHEGGVPAAAVLSFLIDREGALWLGTVGYGAARSLGLDMWEHWGREDGLLVNSVWSIARAASSAAAADTATPAPSTDTRPRGTLWLGLEGRSLPLDRSWPPIPGTSYITAVTRRGRLWLAPYDAGLVRFDPVARRLERFGAPGRVDAATVDEDGQLWLSTRDGIFVIPDPDAAAGASGLVPHEIMPVSDVAAFCPDPTGGVWFVSPGGVFRWRASDGLKRILSLPPGAAQPVAISVTASGELWIGLESHGLLRYAPVPGGYRLLPPAASDHLANITVLFLHRDRHDRMWLGSGSGIELWDHGSWRHFDTSQGLLSNDLNEGAVFEDTDGSMWFGTSHGLSHLIDPDHLPPPTALRPPLITSVTLGGKTFPLDRPAVLPWRRGALRIHFDDLNFAAGRAMRFRYRVNGIDTAWSETSEREIQFATPPTGRFKLTLVGIDTASGAVSPPTVLPIVIRAPWWRHPLFLVAVTLAALGVLVVMWRLRVRYLMRRQTWLEEMIGERTREIEQARKQLARQAAEEQHRLEEMVEQRTSEIQQARAELQRLAMSDPLTGLPNRRALMLTLEHAVREVQSAATPPEPPHATLPLAVLLCDLDHFKTINDRYGHIAGDQVLAAFGGRLGACLGEDEIAGRYGGEEFLIILRGEAAAVAARMDAIRDLLVRLPYRLGDIQKTITFSGGLAQLRPDDTVVSLVARADAALYRAKDNGRARIEAEREDAARPAAPAAGWDSLLERDLRAALDGAEFSLHFQPVVDIARNVVTSCEALLRWVSPARGPVSPAVFIPFAERHGLMEAIDSWVLRAACAEAVRWPEAVRLSVNLSPAHFYRVDLVDDIRAVLAATRLPASRLELEVTETTMIANIDGAAEVLARLRGQGISIALDDFGTGYSSLSFLNSLPFDRIKIDRSFVQDLGTRPEAAAIIGGVIHLCTGLGAAVTAEGAESSRQIALLRRAGCREVQGFGIARPMPQNDIQDWLRRFAAAARSGADPVRDLIAETR